MRIIVEGCKKGTENVPPAVTRLANQVMTMEELFET
jgi:hypothetical protein